jgi:DtxR family transcriptional regulator, Mn-dependent transcriptional regulator
LFLCTVKSFSLSRSEEDHLKAIHSLVADGGRASTNAISERLSTKASSVTDMLKKLAEKGLVKHEPYHGANLTAKGLTLALRLVRKHRLWETFLVSRLGFGWNEVHEVAEQLEHVSSEKLVEKLDEYLGRPAFDPHGDPIPDKNGKMKQRTLERLTECAVGASVRIVAVEHTSDALLDHLDQKGIAIGMRFQVSARHEFDGSIELRVKNGPVYNLSSQVAQHLFVERP